MTRVSGILLAGGAGRRFGRDKLLAPLDGVPLFAHPLRALAAACDEVLVVLAPDASFPPLPREAASARIVRDEVAYDGPLAGARTGLRAARGTSALIVGGDMPGVRSELLLLMSERLAAGDRDAVVLADDQGPRPLPAAVHVAAALRLADELLDGGERRLRALVTGLRAAVLAEDDWAGADPGGAWRRDVDTPRDLPSVDPWR